VVQLISPKIEELVRSIAMVTGHSLDFLLDPQTEALADAEWPVVGEEETRYGILRVSGSIGPIAETQAAVYRQLAAIAAQEIDLRRQNLSLENRYRILDRQVVELSAVNRALTEMAYRDPLTDVYRRWYLFEQVRLELTRAARYGRPFSLLVVDLDHFKSVNDEYGHPAGDAVLQRFAKLLVDSCRNSDIVARYGGDEFCALLTDTPLDGAIEVAERIRRRAAETSVAFGDASLQITTSIGVASYCGEAALRQISAEEIFAQVDRTMYRAKRDGRNRVAVLGAEIAASA
ncbi:MAG TPA: GGDEF domain-containing protein, partial [Thermoanaerobaculia bacterium]